MLASSTLTFALDRSPGRAMGAFRLAVDDAELLGDAVIANGPFNAQQSAQRMITQGGSKVGFFTGRRHGGIAAGSVVMGHEIISQGINDSFEFRRLDFLDDNECRPAETHRSHEGGREGDLVGTVQVRGVHILAREGKGAGDGPLARLSRVVKNVQVGLINPYDHGEFHGGTIADQCRIVRERWLPGGGACGMLRPMLKIIVNAIIALPLLTLFVAAPYRGMAAERFITLASTTSTVASGLYDRILPVFSKSTGIAVHVIAVGTGQALRLSRNGDADGLLVHHPPSEETFLKAGYGVDRRLVMYNQFLIAGPKSDPANAAGAENVSEALRRIAAKGVPFISRADDSGTHKKELGLWRTAQVDPKPGSGIWYMETGSGMGATLRMATATNGYTLTDRGTWLTYRDRGGMTAVFDQADRGLRNQYSVIMVNPARHPHVKAADIRVFMDWLTAPAGQAAIAAVTVGGKKLFIPNAK